MCFERESAWLGAMFALFASLVAFGIGNMVQANSVAETLAQSLSIPHRLSGVLLAIVVAV